MGLGDRRHIEESVIFSWWWYFQDIYFWTVKQRGEVFNKDMHTQYYAVVVVPDSSVMITSVIVFSILFEKECKLEFTKQFADGSREKVVMEESDITIFNYLFYEPKIYMNSVLVIVNNAGI